MSDPVMIPFSVSERSMVPCTNGLVAMLLKADGIHMPIWIGRLEAEAIVIELGVKSFSRPLAYDLLKNILIELGAPVVKIIIYDLYQETYFARVYIEKDFQVIMFDARPSDAIALALRFGAPMLINRNIVKSNAESPMITNFLEEVAEKYPDALLEE